jgi:hypothetical protein
VPRSTRPIALAVDDSSRSVIRLVPTRGVRAPVARTPGRAARAERTLNAAEIERLGTALMQLEETAHDLAERHGIDSGCVNPDLGPLGTLR